MGYITARSKLCALNPAQARKQVQTESLSAPDLQKALVQVYLRLLRIFLAHSFFFALNPIQAKELVQTEGWLAHDLQKALVQVYLRMDELLMRDEARPELEGLAGGASPSDSG